MYLFISLGAFEASSFDNHFCVLALYPARPDRVAAATGEEKEKEEESGVEGGRQDSSYGTVSVVDELRKKTVNIGI